jgi:hypothetical protein
MVALELPELLDGHQVEGSCPVDLGVLSFADQHEVVRLVPLILWKIGESTG